MEVGVAIGRTFADMVRRGDDASVGSAKLPSGRGAPGRAVLSTRDMARDGPGVRPSAIICFPHATTTATSTVSDRKGA